MKKITNKILIIVISSLTIIYICGSIFLFNSLYKGKLHEHLSIFFKMDEDRYHESTIEFEEYLDTRGLKPGEAEIIIEDEVEIDTIQE
ncbi:hypothetical protein LJC68_10465 [Bacteroidales bacterium OttesenSCG-928-B11]|nr:hypothetical protein [Bacteroidales bacterium OttesenSCG-928-E04]MDL2308033.1 hypothetical protein [Bacteroidales bacterium OttesenSCG-928-C03]MDL2313285.1 hypothetical protein [Bacteroidales bacterium OttesenSCG-928-B11]MDL2325489.1 hypothetical protein [Bacteroidales bacterium OttesenSCG-928-A14]